MRVPWLGDWGALVKAGMAGMAGNAGGAANAGTQSMIAESGGAR